jgi:hypothetical protein
LAINKNFVVKHGLEVNTNLILANADNGLVGIATTNPQYALHVNGGIGATDVYVSGIATLTNLTGTNLSYTGISTVANFTITPSGVGATVGNAGIITYYGDGSYLDLSGNTSGGIGIGTTGGLVGYGITFLNLYGAGVSTAFYDGTVGIATIFFEGGGGGGAIGIGSTFPGTPASTQPVPSNGDLFFHIDYGRTFIYYDEVILGVGSSAFWIDSSPFNVGVITALVGVIAFDDGTAITPSWYFYDDQTTGVFSPTNGELTFVSTGSSVLNINPDGIIVTGVTTSTKATIGAATTFPEDLVVQGDARVTGILTVGTTSIILDGASGNIDAPGTITASSFSGTVAGTATSTTNIPNLTGDITSDNTTTTLATVNANVGTFGDGGAIPSITVNAKGLVTGVSTSSITLATVNANVGTFGDGGAIPSITVNAKGLVTGVSTSAIVSGITITDDTSTNATRYVTFTSATSGTITGENVSSSKLTYNPSTGTLAATNVNSTSDEALKGNITTIENALELVNQLRGVEFTWKETNEQSLGVVAQEVEKVLPELVKTDDFKSVNYNGLIGVLIEAVKELSARVKELEG